MYFTDDQLERISTGGDIDITITPTSYEVRAWKKNTLIQYLHIYAIYPSGVYVLYFIYLERGNHVNILQTNRTNTITSN